MSKKTTKKAKADTAVATTATKKQVTVTTRATVPKIKDTTNLRNQGIILIRQNAIQDIYKLSGNNAIGNEFQVHYWFLNLRFRAEDSSILDIAIPTVYFNYKQEVTAAHIDFDLVDVGNISAKLLPLHNAKVNELQATSFIKNLESLLDVKFELMSVDLGSIHRHPGSSRSQSFSSTDLCKDSTEPGVCYPLAKAENDKPNFAGIMAIDSGTNHVAHYEYRVANGEIGKDITYTKGRCVALIDDPSDPLSIVERMFEETPRDTFYAKTNNCTMNEVFEDIMKLFQNLDFQPDTRPIDATHVEKKATSYGYGYFSKATDHELKNLFDMIDQEELKEAQEFLKSCNGLDILDPKALPKKTDSVLLTHLEKLEKAYYGKSFPIAKAISREELIDDITSLQETIIEEYNAAKDIVESVNKAKTVTKPAKATITVTEMKQKLMEFGTPPSMLKNVSNDTVKKWYNNIMK